MNDRIKELRKQVSIDMHLHNIEDIRAMEGCFGQEGGNKIVNDYIEKFAELIVGECINREELLGAIARGWCSEKNSHKTMDPDLALAIFDEVERQIKQHFGVK